eukprot:1135196-Rhodomonas_salina.2
MLGGVGQSDRNWPLPVPPDNLKCQDAPAADGRIPPQNVRKDHGRPQTWAVATRTWGTMLKSSGRGSSH